MNDPFTMRVRAAAVAGWWTVLIGVLFVWLLWAVFLILISNSNPPAWLESLAGVGHGISWSDLQHDTLWLVCCFKLFLWLLVLASVWLTLWARQLKKGT